MAPTESARAEEGAADEGELPQPPARGRLAAATRVPVARAVSPEEMLTRSLSSSFGLRDEDEAEGVLQSPAGGVVALGAVAALDDAPHPPAAFSHSASAAEEELAVAAGGVEAGGAP